MTNEQLDPEMGEPHETDPAGQPAGADSAGAAEIDGQLVEEEVVEVVDPTVEAEAKVAELTNDLQRKHAEFMNFRKRTLRDIDDAKIKAKGAVLASMLDVLDDVDRARAHGDLEEGPLRAFADKLVAALSGQGLTAYGEVGDVFDAELHEAVQHSGDGEVPVVTAVLRRGYRADDKVLRTAMVVVEDQPAAAGAAE